MFTLKKTFELTKMCLFRNADMIMAACFNGRERNMNDWRSLFEKTDERFVFKGITETLGSVFSIIEAVWEP